MECEDICETGTIRYYQWNECWWNRNMIICDFDLMKQGAAATGVEATTVVNYSKEQVANWIMVVMMPILRVMMPMVVAILTNAGFSYYQ